PLAWLSGTWEVDVSVGNNSDYNLYKYGVCTSHFNFDISKLHNSTKKRSISESNNCIQHSWSIVGRNVQVPCLGLKSCPAFTEIHNIASNTSNEQRVCNICTECFVACGGHLHIRDGSGNKSRLCTENGMHKDDAALTLDLFANWISKVANSGNEDEKRRLIWHLIPLLETTKIPENNISTMIPNPLLIKTAMKLNNLDPNLPTEQSDLKVEDYKKYGEELGISIWNSRKALKQNLYILENPTNLDEYCDAFPKTLTGFFDGLVSSIKQKRHKITERKRKQNGKLPKDFDTSS
ncbi:3719_t:CDS:2, partial [Entrophospora sp. SA101]